MRAVTIVLALTLAATVTVAEPLLTAYRAPAPPALDGDLSDACWQSASLASAFLSADGPGLPDEQTQVRASWDDANLYLGVEAFDAYLDPKLNMMHMVVAEKSGEDARVFSDDCIEIFLNPPGDDWFQLAANSGDGTWDANRGNDEFDSGWQCVARRGPGSYVLEIAIPFAALGAGPDAPWRANFARERTAVDENSTWCGLQGAFSQPELFGTLAFAETGPAIGPVDFERDGSQYRFQTAVAGDAPAELVARVRSGKWTEDATAMGTGALSVNVPLPRGAWEAGRVELTYALRQGDTDLLRSAAIEQSLAARSVTVSVDPRTAQAEVFVNGQQTTLVEGAVSVELEEGMNFLAMQAERQVNAAGVAVEVTAGDRTVGPGWVCRADDPGEGWMTELPGEGWAKPRLTRGAIWPQGAGERAWFVRALYVGAVGPQFFPKLDIFYVSRGSTQLMRLYLHAPTEIPPDDYAMVVEAPKALRYVAAEPVSGGTPVVSRGGTVQADGAELRRWAVGYDPIPAQGMEISLRWGDATGSTLAYIPSIQSGGTFDWRHLSLTVTAPIGAESVHPLIIKWQSRGIVGTFWIDNVVFRTEGSDENLLKMGTFDEPEWGSSSRLAPEGPGGSICCKIVSTPESKDKQQALWVDKEEVIPVKAGQRYVIECDARCENVGSPGGKPLTGLLLRAPEDMPEGEYPVYTYFTALDGLITELPHRSRTTVLPPLKNKRPVHARITPCYYGSRLISDEVGRAYAESCWASGITWTYGRVENNVVPHLLARGHRVILSIGWAPWNPMGASRDMIEERGDLQAVNFEGKRIRHKFCPTWLLSDDAEAADALTEIETWLLATVNSQPYYGADWDLEEPVVDPPTYCTCERCRTAFRAYAQLPADTEITPELLLADHRDAWVDFRCAQNAEMAGRLRDMLRKADRPIEFSLYSGFESERTKEHYGVDWAKMAPNLDHAIAGYGGNRQLIRDTVEACGDVPFMGGEMWYLSYNDDARPAPRMEIWRNRLLRQYVDSSCHGVLIWQLASMDGGAFYATSEATEIIADYEDWFVDGQRCDDRAEVDGLEASNWAAFEKGGQTLVLLMSFDPEPLSVTVSVAGDRVRRTIEPYGVEVLIMP